VTNPRKVPAGKGAVNDIGQPAPGRTLAGPDQPRRACGGGGEFCRGMV